MLTELIKLADRLDRDGDSGGADELDSMIAMFNDLKGKNVETTEAMLEFANNLDKKGLFSEADVIQDILRKNAEEDDEEEEDESELHDMSLKDLVSKVKDDGLESISLKLNGYGIHLHRDKED